MARTFEVITPEQVAIRYELAGIGSRAAAMLMDMGILHLLIQPLIVGFFALLVWLKILPSWGTMEHWYALQESLVTGLLVLLFFLTTWGYYLLFETFWNGETPGKRWMGLRVIRDDGHPVDFRAVLIRNLLRSVDSMPLTYSVAFVTVLLSPQYRRLGDYAAGTVVVRHARDDQDGPARASFGDAVVCRLLDTVTGAHLARLQRDDLRVAQRFLARRTALPFALRGEFARRLAQPLIEKMGYQPPTLGMDYERWLEELVLAHRTRAGQYTPAPPPTPVVTPETPRAPLEDDPDARKW